MESNIMAKPVGGRGQKASKPTIMRRIPEGIKEAIEILSDLYRDEQWDGSVEDLNLISGNKQKSLDANKPDIKNQLEELKELQEWKRRAEVQFREMADLKESFTQLQRAIIQADRDFARAIAMKCGADDEVKRLQTERDELDKENSQLHERNGDLGLQVQKLQEEIAALKSAATDIGRSELKGESPDLDEIRSRILKKTRSDQLKAAEKALDKFIAELKAVDS